MITFDPDALSARRAELEAETVQPGFWDDQRRAARTSSELARTQRNLDMFERLQDETGELDGMLEMAAEDPEWKAELERSLAALTADLGRLQEEALFTGEYDTGPAVVGVHAGAGGTDSQDWAEMLLRMYLRWGEARGFKTELLEATPGEEAGLKSATFTLTGDNAYGIMQAEKGVHRLVRLSPFDSAHRRHTSFAQVEVSPFVDDDVDVEIDEADLRIDTYRSQGAGGQHVNKTDSAVRLTHIPTGIVVQCQNERSQLQNKAQAMRILKSRLIEREHEERQAAMAKERGEAQDISFGSQIRSYVLHPYTMVNDHRTNVKVGNAQGVLDGDLDELIRAELLRRAAVAPKGV
ncbi:MAG TPA: peptide chain release factor 2 [Gaiellales bacterium]|nr:peptide chain release factor 2 [Gaiellales bacterium]